MVKVDYICTKDIDRVAKIHSNKKYVNWNLKVVDNEYRFYPPITIEINEDDLLDDFEFNEVEEDYTEIDSYLEPVKVKVKNIPMFGELWEKGSFLKENKFNFVNVLEESITDKKIKGIKKYSNRSLKLDKYKEKFDFDIRINKNPATLIKKEKFVVNSKDFYKLYKVSNNRQILSNIKKYENEKIEENIKVSKNKAISAKIGRFIGKLDDEIEILTLEEDYA